MSDIDDELVQRIVDQLHGRLEGTIAEQLNPTDKTSGAAGRAEASRRFGNRTA